MASSLDLTGLTVVVVGRSELADAFAEALEARGPDVERAETATVVPTIQAAAPDLVVLGPAVSTDGGRAVREAIKREIGQGEAPSLLVLCGPAMAALAETFRHDWIATLDPQLSTDELAETAVGLLQALAAAEERDGPRRSLRGMLSAVRGSGTFVGMPKATPPDAEPAPPRVEPPKAKRVRRTPVAADSRAPVKTRLGIPSVSSLVSGASAASAPPVGGGAPSPAGPARRAVEPAPAARRTRVGEPAAAVGGAPSAGAAAPAAAPPASAAATETGPVPLSALLERSARRTGGQIALRSGPPHVPLPAAAVALNSPVPEIAVEIDAAELEQRDEREEGRADDTSVRPIVAAERDDEASAVESLPPLPIARPAIAPLLRAVLGGVVAASVGLRARMPRLLASLRARMPRLLASLRARMPWLLASLRARMPQLLASQRSLATRARAALGANRRPPSVSELGSPTEAPAGRPHRRLPAQLRGFAGRPMTIAVAGSALVGVVGMLWLGLAEAPRSQARALSPIEVTGSLVQAVEAADRAERDALTPGTKAATASASERVTKNASPSKGDELAMEDELAEEDEAVLDALEESGGAPHWRKVRIDSANALITRGHKLRRQGRLGMAEAAYLKALKVWPSYPRALSGLVRVHLARRDGVEALRWAKRLVARQPNRGNNQLLLGDAHALMNQKAAARKAWRQSMRYGNRAARKRLAR